MPCWSVLQASVNLGKVNPVLLAAAGAAAGVTVARVGDNISIRGAGWEAVVKADGSMSIRASGAVTWGGVRFDVSTEDGKGALVNAIRRGVSVQAVAQAARAAGLRVQSTGPNTARISGVR